MNDFYVEKWLAFTLIDGHWDIQLWADSAKPVSAKVYRLRIKVPPELIGEVAAEVRESSASTCGDPG
jgi:hypothetical protein